MQIVDIMLRSVTIGQAEKLVREFVHRGIFPATHQLIAANRAELYSNQISPWIFGNNVLDLGCGTGVIGVLVEKQTRCKITFADTINYLQIDRPFVQLANQFPFADDTFDTTLIITVLHHTCHVKETLNEAARVTRRRLIIKESVIGLSPEDDGAQDSFTLAFVELAEHMQFLYTCFVDWFFNRVLEADVDVPFAFKSVNQWREALESIGNIVSIIRLGIDDPIGALYHVLFIVDMI